MKLTDRQVVRRLARQLNLRPSRSSGQHFLIDGEVLRRTLELAELTPDDVVFEIGPGLGALTEALLRRAGRVIAVERDLQLANFLQEHFADVNHLTLIRQDIFRVRLDQYLTDGGYKLVANFPYRITGLALRNFLTLAPRPERLVVLLQREVADRLRGEAGNRSLLWLLAQLTSTVEVHRLVDRTAFWPAPAVTSALVRLWPCRVLPSEWPTLMRLARLAFASRRKQLKNSLAAGLKLDPKKIQKIIPAAGLEPSVRPQELSLNDWKNLHQVLIDSGAFP